jgi:hypothetical protein
MSYAELREQHFAEALSWALMNPEKEDPFTMRRFTAMSEQDIPRVDHTQPIHDDCCRCRTCKPALVGNNTAQARDLIAGLIVATPVSVILWAIIIAISRVYGW